MKYKVLHSLMVPIILLNITVFAQQPQNPLDKKLKPFHPSAYIFNPLLFGAGIGLFAGIGGTMLGASIAGVASPLVLVKKAEPRDLGNIIKFCAQGSALLGGLWGLKYGFQYTRRKNNFYDRVGPKSLLDIVKEDDIESFKEWLELKPEDVALTDSQGQSLLHYAAECRANKVAKYLIKSNRISAMAFDKKNITPFMLALKHSPDRIAPMMYNSYNSFMRNFLFCSDKSGKMTFEYATTSDWKKKIVKEQGSDMNESALSRALKDNRQQDVAIISRNGNISNSKLYEILNSNENTQSLQRELISIASTIKISNVLNN